MSKTTLSILALAAVLIVLAVIFDLSVVAGGGGVLLLVALGYSYVVSKRETERASEAPSPAE